MKWLLVLFIFCCNLFAADLESIPELVNDANNINTNGMSIVECSNLDTKSNWVEEKKFQVIFNKKSSNRKLDLSVVYFTDAGWNFEKVMERLKKMDSVLSQCGLALGNIDLIQAKSHISGLFSIKTNANLNLIAASLDKSKPVQLIYVEAFDNKTAASIPMILAKQKDSYPEFDFNLLSNTVWISRKVTHPDYTKGLDGHYSTEAHEVTHLLLDSIEHTNDSSANLLHDKLNLVSGKLSKTQCEQMGSSVLLSP